MVMQRVSMNLKKETFGMKGIFVKIICLLLFTACISAGCIQNSTLSMGKLTLAKKERLLILAPHPDDESLACAGVIRYAVKHRLPVKVIVLTNGDGYARDVEVYLNVTRPTAAEFQRLGEIRHEESIAAMRALGLRAKDVIFFSYADGSINSLFEKDWDYDQLHRGLNGCTAAPYSFAYEKAAPYCGANLVKNLEGVIRDFKPTVIFYPNPDDYHHDHWGVGAFAKYVSILTNFRGKQYTYLVHQNGREWPVPSRYAPERELLPPARLVGLDADWLKYPLGTMETTKGKAVRSYRSQERIMEPFLDAFIRKNELFAIYPDIQVRRSTRKEFNFFKAQRLPYKIFSDPRDAFVMREFPNADLTEVGYVYNQQSTWIALETLKDIAPDFRYGFHLRIFQADGAKSHERVRAFDLYVQNQQAQVRPFAQNSIQYKDPIPVTVRKNRMTIQLDNGILFPTKVQRIMLNIDVINPAKHRCDRTPWKIIDLR
ncbi:MAG TPA: PIG-L family deacetylase [Bacillota bacterium]|nr:PIG-L family deacetylase [Bacillota bacterium]